MTARDPEAPFDAPWQARAFALARGVVDSEGLHWDAFRDRLKAAVAEAPERPYWESWLAALERLAVDQGLVTPGELDAVDPLA